VPVVERFLHLLLARRIRDMANVRAADEERADDGDRVAAPHVADVEDPRAAADGRRL